MNQFYANLDGSSLSKSLATCKSPDLKNVLLCRSEGNIAVSRGAFKLSLRTLAVAMLTLLLLPASTTVNAQGKTKKLTDEQVAKLTNNANQPIAFVENKYHLFLYFQFTKNLLHDVDLFFPIWIGNIHDVHKQISELQFS